MTSTADTLLLFGATGDLAQRMLLPSLFALHADRLLPPDLAIIGTARSDMSEDGFRSRAEEALTKYLPDDRRLSGTSGDFLRRLKYVPLDVSNSDGLGGLAKALHNGGTQTTAILLSTAPSLFEPAIAGLRSAGLAGEKARIGLEKPLGRDLPSFRAINDAVLKAFPEERTFRIDHYLGKETVQNLLALRFGNRLFEPLWNASGIDHVQITVAETVGVEGRGAFYDDAGALRDMVQNHMLQLLALVAMCLPRISTPPRCATRRLRFCAHCARSTVRPQRRIASSVNMRQAWSAVRRCAATSMSWALRQALRLCRVEGPC